MNKTTNNQSNNIIQVQIPDNDDSFDSPRWPGKYLCLYRHVNEKRKYTVGAPLSFITKDNTVITVKPGFVTDGASVPRLFWWYASPFAGAHAPAVVLHDALYAAHYGRRGDCDTIFHDAMFSLPIRESKVAAMYRSVRVGGSGAWNKKTSRQQIEAKKLLDVRRLSQ